jgi:hypothetical protein
LFSNGVVQLPSGGDIVDSNGLTVLGGAGGGDRIVNGLNSLTIDGDGNIVLDGYASLNSSTTLHGFDNTSFFDSLKTLGFEFPEKSKSNYSMTFLSLSSSLNMDYLNITN